MSNKAFNKKTLGIKNEKWIDKCTTVVGMTAIALPSAYIMDAFWLLIRDKTKIQYGPDSHEIVIYAHLVGYWMVQIIIFGICCRVANGESLNFLKDAMILGSIIICTAVYQFNPYIIWLKKDSGLVHDALKCTFIVQIITLPFVLSASIIGTWILWRMSKVKPDYDGDEPYEVIYGGEGSSTKKSDESTE